VFLAFADSDGRILFGRESAANRPVADPFRLGCNQGLRCSLGLMAAGISTERYCCWHRLCCRHVRYSVRGGSWSMRVQALDDSGGNGYQGTSANA
jgi:hypothetical protein